MTNNSLSPAAQAVLEAADAVLEQGNASTWLVARGIAAALRAAVQELKYFGVTEKNILEIAAELEANDA